MSVHDHTISTARPQKRPGPFGPARVLLPSDQNVVLMDGKTSASDAIERMVDERFSQVPVTDKTGCIVGVFSWKSFGQRVVDLHSTSLKPTHLQIRDAMEPTRFISPEVYIDTETDWSDLDYVLVGGPSDLFGILCVSDVFGRLNDFAEAFVLIYEVEHAIRDVIEVVCREGELQAILDGITQSANRPAEEAIANLNEFIDQNGPNPAVGKAIKLLKEPRSRPIESLKDLTFSQYRTIICSEKNLPRFEPVFDSLRELVDNDLSDVNEFRNVVFHFRRAITPRDTDRLRRFREKLRYNLELYHRELESTKPTAEVQLQ